MLRIYVSNLLPFIFTFLLLIAPKAMVPYLKIGATRLPLRSSAQQSHQQLTGLPPRTQEYSPSFKCYVLESERAENC